MSHILVAEKIEKSFPRAGSTVEVLQKCDFALSAGETVAVMGASGSGKTVLMKCLVGLMEVDSGSVMYDDQDFSALNHKMRKPLQKQIGMLFQGGALFDSMNVEKNVMMKQKNFCEPVRF